MHSVFKQVLKVTVAIGLLTATAAMLPQRADAGWAHGAVGSGFHGGSMGGWHGGFGEGFRGGWGGGWHGGFGGWRGGGWHGGYGIRAGWSGWHGGWGGFGWRGAAWGIRGVGWGVPGWGYGLPAYGYGYGYGGPALPAPVYTSAGYYGGSYARVAGYRTRSVHLAAYHAHHGCHCTCCR